MDILLIYEEELYADGLEAIIKKCDETINFSRCLLYEDLEKRLAEKPYDIIFATKDSSFDIDYLAPLFKKYNKDCKIVLISRTFTSNDVKKYMQYNINGVICKKYSTKKIEHIIGLIILGENYYPVEILPYSKKTYITASQIKIVKCLRKGYSNKQIAYELNISESTVKTQMSKIMKKFKCYNRVQVIQIALEQGLLEY